MILILIKFYYNYNLFCKKCFINYKKEKQCNSCKNTIIFKGLNIASDEETLNEIIMNNKSISRFGDGEFKIIFGEGCGFQKPNKLLSKRLVEVLNNNEKNLMIGLHIPYKNKDFYNLKNYSKIFYINYLNKYKFKIANIINTNKKYYSSTISRFYIRYKRKKNMSKYLNLLKKIWNSKNILIIEGEKSKVGIGNDLFNNAKSIKRIICPFKNAFSDYDKIIKEVINFHEKRLILIALGPTATILAYDLHKMGYQAIDIGHLDIEYEWYLRNCSKKIQIENKYVNELKDQKYNYNKKDTNYLKQIVGIIK